MHEKEKHNERTLEKFQVQTFNWVEEKISEWSNTPPLKIQLFLYLQISLINATTQILSKIILIDVNASSNLNWTKYKLFQISLINATTQILSKIILIDVKEYFKKKMQIKFRI